MDKQNIKARTDRLTSWKSQLANVRAHLDEDPFANPIELLAAYILKDLRYQAITNSDIKATIDELVGNAFVDRAHKFARYLGECDLEENTAVLNGIFEKVAARGDESFAAFKDEVEKFHYGVVITAHPTFSIRQDVQQRLVETGMHLRSSEASMDANALKEIHSFCHRPTDPMSLEEEHRQSMVAIRNLREAHYSVLKSVRDVAKKRFADNWLSLSPKLISVATWVGYDMDGRSDIGWASSMSKRAIIQIDQIQYYKNKVHALRQRGLADANTTAHLELIETKLALSIKTLQDEIETLGRISPSSGQDLSMLAKMSRDMVSNKSSRLCSREQLLLLIERALNASESELITDELWTLRAQINTFGLAAASTHFRINAIQLYNSIRKEISMDHPVDDPSYRMSYINSVQKLIEEVEPQSVHFGSLHEVKATAKRVFILIRQFLKFYDSSETIRFLIAETESPLALLTALYFAKRFGVHERIDISPLFETSSGIQHGLDILKSTLEVKVFRDYLKIRKRICIETGFSDAGRYLGQIAASHYIEQIRLGMTAILKEAGLTDIEVVIFDTHGESIGRGSHPASFADRLAYFDTRESRLRFASENIQFCQETSFQGGDGYLYFLKYQSSFAVLTRIMEHTFQERGPIEDPFYTSGVFVDEFFASIRKFNVNVFSDKTYAALLGAFGSNLLYITGSRALKRQSERSFGKVDLDHPSQLRAIPHNSILQQYGMLANSIGGIGGAVAKNPDRFYELYRQSPRFRRLMMMVEHAFMYTDLDVVRAYIDLFDPGQWLRRAQLAQSDQEQEEFRKVADYVEEINIYDQLYRIYRTFQRDHCELAIAFKHHRHRTRKEGEQPIAIGTVARDNIHMLHAMRIALMQDLMLKSIRIPDFSDRHNMTHREVIINILRLEVPAAIGILNEVFPVEEKPEEFDFGESADYQEGEQSYAFEHKEIFEPIATNYEYIRDISSGLIYHIGAVG